MAPDDARRRILERRALFMAASLATLGGCPREPPGGLEPTTPVTPRPAPSSRATATAEPPAASSSEPESSAGSSAAPAPAVVRVCLSIRILEQVRFASGTARVLPESEAVLEQTLAILREHPEVRVEVQGHEDLAEQGYARLDVSRAVAVKKYLVEHGVEAARLCARGYGASMPLTRPDGPDHGAANRRVSLRRLEEGEECSGR
ncbi:MAG: OmpA family protein [Polyangiaceae bacterium]|nr:OmpA family protein [Polyangiaceae bacterium]